MNIDTVKKYFWVLLSLFVAALTLVLVFVFVPMMQRATDAAYATRTISVSAQGKTTVVPDTAVTSFSVVSRGVEPKNLTSQNNEIMNKVIAAVKNLGVDSKDIQTTGYNLSPNYTWNPKTGQQSIDGYTMTQTVEVKVRDLGKVSDVVSAVTQLGVNQVGGIQFIVDDQDKYLADARAEALTKARAKAELMAEKAGAALGEVITVSEQSQTPTPMPYYAKLEATGMGGAAPVAPSVEAGSQDLTVTVSVSYALK